VTTKEIASVQVEQALSIYLDSDTVDAFNLKNLTFSSLGEVNIIQHEKVLLDEQKGSTSSYMSALFSIPEFASLGGEVTVVQSKIRTERLSNNTTDFTVNTSHRE